MLEFVKSAFSRSLEVRLWLNLIVTAITGAVAWHSFWLPGRAFIGLLIGIGVGLWSNIAFGGLMATVVVTSEKLDRLNRDIEQLKRKLNATTPVSNAEMGSGSLSDFLNNGGNNNFAQLSNSASPAKTWFCKQCSKENPLADSVCTHCGNPR